jgi:hypothetical protein
VFSKQVVGETAWFEHPNVVRPSSTPLGEKPAKAKNN